MARFLKVCLILLLVGSSHHASAKINGTMLVKNVMGKLGKLNGLIGQAFELYETFEGIYNIFTQTQDNSPSTDDRLDRLDSKMDQLSRDFRGLETKFDEKMKQTQDTNTLQKALETFYEKVDELNGHYDTFLLYANESNVFRESQIEEFSRNRVSENKEGVDSILNGIHQVLSNKVGRANNIPTLLNDPVIVQEFMCEMKRSPQQILHLLFQVVMLSEVKGFTLIMFANEVLNTIERKETTHKEIAIGRFQKRMDNTFWLMKLALNYTSREIWASCDRPLQEGKNYVRFGPVIQKYVIYEKSVYDIDRSTKNDYCGNTCATIKYAVNYPEDKDSERKCRGKIRDCEDHGSSVEYCFADDPYRQFQYFKFGNNKYGRNQLCAQEVIEKTSHLYYTNKCEYCLCTCEDSETKKMDKYISLRSIFSDYRNNKVITAAKIVLKNNVFRIVIKEGTLLSDGFIDPKISKTWKKGDPVNVLDKNTKSGKDYYEIKWDSRTICLDDVDPSLTDYNKNVKKDYVLVGLEFKQENDKLQLVTYIAKFDFHSGIIDARTMDMNKVWKQKRDVFDMRDHDIPIGENIKNDKPIPNEGQCVQLTTSGLEQDAGQNVLPFVDIQPVEPNPPVPLSGAGLFLRIDKREESGGFLALKLFTLNFEPRWQKKTKPIE